MTKIFPYIEVSGSHTDVGHAIGETMGEIIREKIAERKATLENYNSYLDKIPPYYHAARDAFPQLVEELEAIVQAARVDPKDYFLFGTDEIYDISEVWDFQNPDNIDSDHCTIAVSFNSNNPVIGHNEDWALSAIDELYLLKATINNTSFLGLNYATHLPGDSASMNNWGLVQCISSLHHQPKIGVPKNFLARAILACHSLDEAENLIRNTNRASGYNHVLVQNQEIRNIESINGQLAIEKEVGQPYVHTNHCLAPELKQFERYRTKSSIRRYQRAKELVKNNMSREEMIALLSDKSNPRYPICREDATIGSVVLIPNKKEVYICSGHPCAGEFVKYTL